MSMIEAKSLSREMRFQFYHGLQNLYHRYFDEVASSDLPDGEAAKLAQTLLLVRHESLKHLVAVEEMDAYSAAYPEDM